MTEVNFFLPHVSHSMRENLKSCQRKVYFRWVAGIRRKYGDSPARAIGRAFHLGIDAWRKGLGEVQAINEARKHLVESLAKSTSNDRVIEIEQTRLDAYLSGYFRRYQGDLTWDWSESELKFQMKGEIGFIDNVILDSDGLIWIVEDKTTSRPSDHTGAALRLNDQLLSYLCLIQDMGYSRIGGCIYRQTVKCLLKPRAKESLTDFYLRVEEAYQDPSKFLEFRVRYEPEEIDMYRAEKDLLNKWCRQVMETAQCKEDVPRNSAQCIGIYGPCDYLSICSSTTETQNGKLFEATSQEPLDGGELRRILKIEDKDNAKTSSGLRQHDPKTTDKLSCPTIQPAPDAIIWDAGNGENEVCRKLPEFFIPGN